MLNAIEECKGIRRLVDELMTALEGHVHSLGTAQYDAMATALTVFVLTSIE